MSRDLNRVGDVLAFLASGLVVAGIGIRISLVHTLIERWHSTYVVNRSVGDNTAFVVNPCHMREIRDLKYSKHNEVNTGRHHQAKQRPPNTRLIQVLCNYKDSSRSCRSCIHFNNKLPHLKYASIEHCNQENATIVQSP